MNATRAELGRVHDAAYVDAVIQASADPDGDYGEWGLHPFGDTEWRVVENTRHEADDRHPYAFNFQTLERIRKK